jgi:spore germination cell wall hydrolase CwlJ-like protein
VLTRFRHLLRRDDAVHLVGAQLCALVLMSAGLAIAAAPSPGSVRLSMSRSTAAQAVVQPIAVASAEADPDVIRLQDLDPDAARLWNAANPVSTLPNPAARPFKLEANGVLDEARAVDCMTAVIYYEAAYESTEGQRAVAQVVLNRMRHPAFPKTVCGVVFEGSTRATGCQFTFTCDGALARKPTEEGWTRARKVAEAALNGHVMRQVGNATHYHAAYVAPYWSPSLVKVGSIGAHIFYRWTGGAGRPPAFGGRYAGGETAGLQIATLDKLGNTQAKLNLISTADAAAATAPTVIEESTVSLAGEAAEGEAAPEIITAAAVATDVQALTKPEDLDWQGQPKVRQPPRLAMPSVKF